jgi:hypothetical protein
MLKGPMRSTDNRFLISKMQDEDKALQLCQSKVRQKKLPMEVVDAEYQWYVPCFLSHSFSRVLIVVCVGTDES